MKWWKVPLFPFGMALLVILLFLRWLGNEWRGYRNRFPPRWEVIGLMADKGFFREV
ncbi:hypothetical protein [Atrimonas thermophila]|uniref:hypothetical protein n=1 Tax=Atrimonas thermophila TaxID=3064161 RepID=UPI00399C6D11